MKIDELWCGVDPPWIQNEPIPNPRRSKSLVFVRPSLSLFKMSEQKWHLSNITVCAGAGAILSVGLLRSIEWARMEKRFDVDGGVSGGAALTSCSNTHGSLMKGNSNMYNVALHAYALVL